jgi:hypothetical protein
MTETATPPTARRISKYHPALRQTIEALRTARLQEGFFHAYGPGNVHVKVTPAHKARAVRFLHHLFVAIEEKGFEVTPAPHRAWTARYRQGEVVVANAKDMSSLALRTKTNRVKKDESLRPKDSYSWSRFDYPPTDLLLLEIGETNQPRTIIDGVRKRLEDRIENIVGSIAAYFEQCVVEDAERAVRAEERRRDEARRLERIGLQQIETERDAIARKMLADWRDARDMRAIVAVLKDRFGGETDWLSWFERWSDRLDPTVAIVSDPLPSLTPGQ